MSKQKFVLILLSLVCLAVAVGYLTLSPWSRELRERSSIFGEEHEGGRDLLATQYEQRAYPLQTIPENARQEALNQAEREVQRMRRSAKYASEFAQLEADDQRWTSLGPQPLLAPAGDTAIYYSGRVSAIALHPQYDGVSNKTVYVGGAQGGVWRSTDNGQNWTPIMDDQPTQAIGSIAIDPTDANTIYIGTGEGNSAISCYYGAGILKSTNGGTSWSVISGPNSTLAPLKPVFVNAAIPKLVVDPVTPNVIFAATTGASTAAASGGVEGVERGKQRGLWKSSDGGATWKNADPDGTGGQLSAHDIVLDPLNHNTVYAAIRARGIYRSKSGGEPGTWEKLTNGVANASSSSSFDRCQLAAGPAIAPATGTTLYASFARISNSQIFGFYRSTDGGDSWTQVTTPPTEAGAGQAWYNMAVAVDPTNGNQVYYGGKLNYTLNQNCVVRSTDGGQTWADMRSENLHPDTHVLVVAKNNPNIVFTGNDGGIWRTDAASANTVSWTTLNANLSVTQFQAIALHPTDANYLIGGLQDNGTQAYTGGLGWNEADARGGDGGFCLIDQSNPSILYHTFTNDVGSFSPQRSTNGGQTWRQISTGFSSSDRANFYAPMALHPGFSDSNGNVVYFGTNRLYRFANPGTTWTGLGASGDGFGQDLTKGSGYVSAITAYPKLDTASPPTEIVWVGTSDGNIQVTSNAGALANATFTNATKAPLPNRFVGDIAVDASNANRAVAVFSGFEANTPTTLGHVFLTTDRGNSWTNISGNLPDTPVTTVALDPNNTNRIWIGSDIGVFQTTDGGTTWMPMTNGLPKLAIFMLRYQNNTGNLIAATHGRGVFRLRTNTGATSVSGASYLGTNVARDSIVSVFGVNLSTVSAGTAAASTPLPTTLAGTTVTVRDSQGTDRLAQLFFVGPLQINYLVPSGTANGLATVTIRNALGEQAAGTINITGVTPGLFAANADGAGATAGKAIRVRNGVQSPREEIIVLDTATNKYVTKPIDFSPTTEDVFIELYGTGIRNRSSQANVGVEIGGVTIPVEYADVAPGFFGLDQVNIKLPASLDNRGEVDLTVIVDGQRSKTLKINIK
ncbi:MAG: hypothetical protein U0Y68_17555 [Blastocatellia bacterium]